MARWILDKENVAGAYRLVREARSARAEIDLPREGLFEGESDIVLWNRLATASVNDLAGLSRDELEGDVVGVVALSMVSNDF